MRDILFKAKRLDNGEWVEGSCVNVSNKHFYIFTGKLDISNGYLDFEKYSINPGTLCQYTGLADKNGNKIWENDVVRKSDINALGYGRVRNCEVSFDKLGCWLLTTKYGDGYWLGSFDAVQLEVIRTIFDNPELLEDE